MPIIRNPLVMGESDESSEDDMILPSLEPCSQRLARLAAHKGHPTTISDDTDKDDVSFTINILYVLLSTNFKVTNR